MFQQTDRPSPPSPLRLGALVLHLLFTHSCRGQSQMIGPPHPIVARVGDDIILPCHLEPAVDVSAEMLEWKRHDLNPKFVFVLRSGQDLQNVKNPSYKGRTSVFMDELKHGNVSLKLSKVQLSDQGTYECFLPVQQKRSSVKIMIASDTPSSPEITLLGVDRNRGAVILHCESKGWYPEPEASWLDGEGNLLSAGPAETVRGPDDLYTVSSRVTVEKRHSNRFTCRVQQKDINQTREAHIHVPDDFFEIQTNCSSVTGLAVFLAVCILIILLLVFFVWRLNKNKTKRTTEENKKDYESKDDREREQLTTDETVDDLNAKIKKLKEEKKESEETLQKQINDLNVEVRRLTEEKWKSEDERQKRQTDLDMKINQVKRLTAELKEEKKKSQNKEKELEEMKCKLQELENSKK